MMVDDPVGQFLDEMELVAAPGSRQLKRTESHERGCHTAHSCTQFFDHIATAVTSSSQQRQ